MANLITFDGLSLPNGEIKEKYTNIETIKQSEAGTDIGIVTRLMKLTLAVTIKCDGHFLSTLKAKASMSAGTLSYRGRTATARLRIEEVEFERYSDLIDGADGLWTVGFTITEV